MLDLVERVANDADEEVERKKGADKHPYDREEGGGRVVIAHGRVARLGRGHHHEHGRLPIVPRAHDKQQPHGAPEIVKGAEGRACPPEYSAKILATAAAAAQLPVVVGVWVVVAAAAITNALGGGKDGRVGARRKLAHEELHTQNPEDALDREQEAEGIRGGRQCLGEGRDDQLHRRCA